MHSSHKEILDEIKRQSGTATKHTFQENYFGNAHPRYEISSPKMRLIASRWMKENKELDAEELAQILTSLIEGPSFNEKCIAGLILDYARPEQRKFKIRYFDRWLEHLQGWAEIDTLCTGKYAKMEIPANFKVWLPQLNKWAKSKLIEKRRASLVSLCQAFTHSTDEEVADAALSLMKTLMHERDILITKAISWLMRSMIRHHRKKVEVFLKENRNELPAIAVRETTVKLHTGTKSGKRKAE